MLAADVSANKQGGTLEETLKTHDSEIRKLWAVAYDRNRNAIAENTETLKALEAKLAATRDSLSTQSKRVAIQADAFNDIEVGYNKLIPAVASVQEKLEQTITDVTKLKIATDTQSQQAVAQQQSLAALTGKLEAQTLSLEQIAQNVSQLETSLAELSATPSGADANQLLEITNQLAKHQEAIESNDTFRIQINAEINRLRQQANQILLQQQLEAEN